MNILFFGDIMGKIGRKAVKKILPLWKKKYKPDFVIANGENLAHGTGVTEKTVREVFEAGVDFLTGGNHSLKREAEFHIWDDSVFGLKMTRPANMSGPGEGIRTVDVKGKKLMIINLMGRVFFKEEYEDPFKTIDEILSIAKQRETKTQNNAKPTPSNLPLPEGGGGKVGEEEFGVVSRNVSRGLALVDFHAEATSEKNALAWYLDGRVSAVIGTHTHIPTCDARILPKGTAYITDAGMVGERDSVLGVNKEVIIEAFLKDTGFKHVVAEKGEAIVSAVLIKIDEKTGKAKGIKRLEEIINVE